MTKKQEETNYGTIEKTGDVNETPIVVTNKHEEHSIVGILFIMLGAFSFSIMFFLVKLMSSTNTFTLVFYRSIVQIAISYTTLISRGESPFGAPGVRWLLSVRGIFGAGAVCAWFFGIQVLPLPDAVTLQFTTPPFAAAFAVCMVGEAWKPLDIIGAVVCFAGVFFIAHSSEREVGDDSSDTSILLKALAVLVTTGGAALAGIAYVCVRKIGDRASAVVMVLYYGVFSIPMVILGSGWLLNKWDVWSDPNLTVQDYFIMLIMGLGGYGGQFFTNLGLQRETAATATLATCTQIVWTYIFELAFLHEIINGWSFLGTALILGYMLVVAMLKVVDSRHRVEEVPLLASNDPEAALSR